MFKISLLNILTVIAWSNVILWLVGFLVTLRGLSRQKPLAPLDKAFVNANAPFVSILVPARNEEHRSLFQSLHSFLSQDYLNFEVVAVNDRSTDGTGDIMREVAAANNKLKVIEGKELPEDWLGKPHAMQQAFDSSKGEWILATDADMIFDSRAISTALNHALKNNCDALTLIPHIDCLSFWECVFMPTFGWYCVMAMPVERVNNPERKESMGVGGFFLIRREALERVGQYESVKADVAEDLRMAENLKGSGARLRIEYAPDLARTRMQTNLKEIWEGFTKNLFAGAKFSLLQTFFGVSSVFFLAVLPPIACFICALLVLFGGQNQLLMLIIPCLFVYVLQVLVYIAINNEWKIPLKYSLVTPLGHALFLAIMLNSTIKIVSGKGVTWKGRRFYEKNGVRPPNESVGR